MVELSFLHPHFDDDNGVDLHDFLRDKLYYYLQQGKNTGNFELVYAKNDDENEHLVPVTRLAAVSYRKCNLKVSYGSTDWHRPNPKLIRVIHCSDEIRVDLKEITRGAAFDKEEWHPYTYNGWYWCYEDYLEILDELNAKYVKEHPEEFEYEEPYDAYSNFINDVLDGDPEAYWNID